ncbi:hypothetical protein SAY87_007276 [Trapa incisa]|uniref:TIR domain-containing protein n=1 Tax=Trapa incisa TaxID=236973 RepID=A0AAN7K0R3_9MYRT|nr:hypothetical protein SAY87_007276 [Trapa incisa]
MGPWIHLESRSGERLSTKPHPWRVGVRKTGESPFLVVSVFLLDWLLSKLDKRQSEKQDKDLVMIAKRVKAVISSSRNMEELQRVTHKAEKLKAGISSQTTHRYDVFMNITSRFTEYGIGGGLYHRLIDKGYQVFGLVSVGEDIDSTAVQAMTHSKVCIPIFSLGKSEGISMDYLDELVVMLELNKSQGHKIFPIYHNTEPYKVRSFTYRGYKEQVDPHTIKKWRCAISEITSFKGWVLPDDSDYDDEMSPHSSLEIDHLISYVEGLIKEEASPTATEIIGDYDYDVVFFNFTSGGIGDDFAKNLFDKLENAGVRVFKVEADVSMEVGALPVMKLQSRISLPIFTQGYANREVFMDMIVGMVEHRSQSHGRRIFPVFYNIDPHMTEKGIWGYFNMSSPRRGIWEWAMKVISLLKGWEVNDGSDASEWLEDIVSHVVLSLVDISSLNQDIISKSLTSSPTQRAQGHDYDVFLISQSYNVYCRKVANCLYKCLHNAGVHVFRYDDDVPVGEDMFDYALQAMKSSSTLIHIHIRPMNRSIIRWDCLVFLLIRMPECKWKRIVHIYYNCVPGSEFWPGMVDYRDRLIHEKLEAFTCKILEALNNESYTPRPPISLLEDLELDVENLELDAEEKLDLDMGELELDASDTGSSFDISTQPNQATGDNLQGAICPKGDIYAKALEDHKKEHNDQKVQSWKESLKKVGKIKGYELKDYQGHGKFTKMFVRDILAKLEVKQIALTDPLVQRDDQVDAIMNLLYLGDAEQVHYVGIYGMGGIGKTTLAKIVYNKLLCQQFDHCNFLPDVRESSNQHKGIEKLQKQLLYNGRGTSRDFMDAVDGIEEIRKVLGHKRVLIVLDDVDHKKQMDNLVGESGQPWLGGGSIIIVTTRNRDLMEGSNFYTYQVEEMEFDEALRLFSMHAFRKESPPKCSLDISKEAVESTGGLPLALEVIGSYLHDKHPDKWAETIRRLKKTPHEDVQAKLKISYDALEQKTREIFLDIACMFIGYEFTFPLYMWRSRFEDADHRIGQLIQMSLVKDVRLDIRKEGLWMHDQLRDLGRYIVDIERNEKGTTRVWTDNEAFELLEEDEVVNKLKVLDLSYTSLGKTPDLSNYTSLERNIICNWGCEVARSLGFIAYKNQSTASFHWEFENAGNVEYKRMPLLDRTSIRNQGVYGAVGIRRQPGEHPQESGVKRYAVLVVYKVKQLLAPNLYFDDEHS